MRYHPLRWPPLDGSTYPPPDIPTPPPHQKVPTTPPEGTWDQEYTCENITFPQLRWWAVITLSRAKSFILV